MKKFLIFFFVCLLLLTACNRKSEEEQIKEGMDKAKIEKIKKKQNISEEAIKKKQQTNSLKNAPLLIDNSVTNNDYKIKVLRAKKFMKESNDYSNIVIISFLTKNKSGRNINPLTAFKESFSLIQEKQGVYLELESTSPPLVNSYRSKIEKQSISIPKNKTVISVISFKINNLQTPIYIKSRKTGEVISINPNNL